MTPRKEALIYTNKKMTHKQVIMVEGQKGYITIFTYILHFLHGGHIELTLVKY